MPLPDRVWHEHGQDLDHAGYADSVGYGEFKSLTRDRRTLGGTRQTEFRRSMAELGNILANPANPANPVNPANPAKMRQMRPKIAKVRPKMAKMRSPR